MSGSNATAGRDTGSLVTLIRTLPTRPSQQPFEHSGAGVVPHPLGVLDRRGAVVATGPERGVGAMREQQPRGGFVALADGEVERRVVVDPARVGIGAAREQEAHQIDLVGPIVAERAVDRRKSVWGLEVGV